MSTWCELFSGKSSIYVLDKISKEWVERGSSGHLIMLQNNQSSNDIRLKWVTNHSEISWQLMSGELKSNNDTTCILKANNISNSEEEVLAIKFSNDQLTQQFTNDFYQIFPRSQQENSLNKLPPAPYPEQQAISNAKTIELKQEGSPFASPHSK